MLEDDTMDKKSRNSQQSGKTNAVDTVKLKDGINAKPSKTGYNRESSGSSRSSKQEPSRKPNPQKSKAFDKRPRSRSQYYSGPKDNSEQVTNGEAEFGSLLVRETKKTSLNHLLNFFFVPRDGVQYSANKWQNNSNKKFHISHFSARPKYTKEQFLQANCQFIVKAGEDYSVYGTNPDLLVIWDSIEQIRLRGYDIPSCPICLYPPVAAKMTRCGHVYCWPCMLHYLSLSDHDSRKCPICDEQVKQDELKSFVAIPQTPVHVHGEITLQLMRRERNSLIPIPVSLIDANPDLKDIKGPLQVENLLNDKLQSKLLVANSQQVSSSILLREKVELETKLEEEKDCPEACFIEQALQFLKDREETTHVITQCSFVKDTIPTSPPPVEIEPCIEPSSQNNIEEPREPCVIYASAFDDELFDEAASGSPPSDGAMVMEDITDGYKRARNDSSVSDGQGSDETCHAGDDLDLSHVENIPKRSNNSGIQARTTTYYFYQATEGRTIYLNSLNTQMLVHQYKALEHCPRIIKVKVVEIDSVSMTEELRSRLRYLGHLPVACPFEVVEVALKQPLVSRDTLNAFQEKIDARRRSRVRRARDERRREKRIAEEENRSMFGRFPSARIRINSRYQFPDCNTRNKYAAAIPIPEATAPAEDSFMTEVTPVFYLENPDLKTDPGTPSFAQMLRDGKSKSSSVNNNHRLNNATTPSSVGHQINGSDGSEPEDYVPAPQHHSFGEAIANALKNADDNGKDMASSGKKKRKQKSKVLFSTSMSTYAGN